WLRPAADDAVGVLDVRVVAALGGHIGGEHPGGAALPGLATVIGRPDAPAGDAHGHAAAVPRVDADRVDARQVGAPSEPLAPLGVSPERFDQRPGLAPVLRAEQAARERPAPEDARLVGEAGLQGPDLLQLPGDRLAGHRVAVDLART